jgi:hypothetical protein
MRLINRIALAAILLLLTGCGPKAVAEAGASVWIDVPVDGISVPEGQPIQIEGHASPAGINRVEILVNGALVESITQLASLGEISSFRAMWTPSSPGDYVIQAVAYHSDGSISPADSTRVTVGGKQISLPDLQIASVEAVVAGDKGGVPFCNIRVVYTNAGTITLGSDFSIQFLFDSATQQTVLVAGGLAPGATAEAIFVYQFTDTHYIGINLDTDNVVDESNELNNAFVEARMCPAGPTPVPLPVITIFPTLTYTPLPQRVVQFWAEPAQLKAGECTTLRWHVEAAAKVIFGGIEQQMDGSYRDCMCKTQTYPLTVVWPDQTEEKYPLNIPVEGTCATVTPTKVVRPPVPEPVVPANGLTLSCRAKQDLVWTPVKPAGGLREYRVMVQRHSGDNNWNGVAGSPFTGIGGKSMSLNVECGWYYRWRVRAVDNLGIISDWSTWSQFTVTLE